MNLFGVDVVNNVIQSEAKNLVCIYVYVFEILRYALDDN